MKLFLLMFIFTTEVCSRTTFEQIINNKPTIDKAYAKEVANVIDFYADKYKVPANIMAAILMAESGYELGANNKTSNDYGIGQISLWNVNTYGLSIVRLLTDLSYSVNWAFHIFEWLYRRMPIEEAISRYNCGFQRKNKIDCIKWDSVIKYYERVNGYM